MATNPYAPPRATVKDVRDPRASTVPADRGTRLGATMLDGLIFAGMVYLPLFLIVILGPGAAILTGGGQRTGAAATMFIVGGLLAIAGFGTWCVFTIRYLNENGQSIAKRMLGIKVVRADGTPISLGRIFWMRNFLNSAITVIPVLGFLYTLADMLFIFGESRQCLHDKLADTIVVRA
jgi:uncharacterized RDD family membrane protein YckC